MAFQQPQRHPIPRHSSLHTPVAALQPVVTPQSATREPLVEQSQEWVLFSQEHAHTEDAVSTASPRTLGRTQYSDIGSLDTAAVSKRNDDDTNLPERDNDDLDSLDDGLHEFSKEHSSREAVDESNQTVLPQHDGMGMFPGSSAAVQEQHWQHERHNPRRRRLSARRSSLQRRVDALDQVEEPRNADEERTQRIEKWRLDQSRAVLDEIERETRRLRQKGRLSDARASQAAMDTQSPSPTPSAPAAVQRPAIPAEEPASESLWERFKRRVIKEFMGIDDATLSFIFGEALPTDGTEDEVRSRRLNILQEVEDGVPHEFALARTSDHWEERLLARIAKELGGLLHQLSEHPGAFSSYLRTQDPLPYAGLATPRVSMAHLRSTEAHRQTGPQPPSTPHFAPTLPPQQRPTRPLHRRSSTAETASLWGIEEEDDAIEPSMAYQRHSANAVGSQSQHIQREREYWERDLDIKMVFGYLRSRLSASSPSSSPPNNDASQTPDPAAALVSSAAANYNPPLATTAHSDSLRRAALIRHHHPLVNRNHKHNAAALASSSARSLQFQQHQHQHQHQHRRGSSALSAPLSPILGRRDSSSRSLIFDDEEEELGRGLGLAVGAGGMSSCASQAARSQSKKSKTQHSASLGGGSSRNYWDLGAGSVGSWGEV